MMHTRAAHDGAAGSCVEYGFRDLEI